LVDAGGGMMALIADLEMVSTEHPEQPLFRHLLGDAYMRNGQLQKALDTYRMALDQI
jgi:cytochrome c-type biogenesis protein CcmH/NrfG